MLEVLVVELLGWCLMQFDGVALKDSVGHLVERFHSVQRLALWEGRAAKQFCDDLSQVMQTQHLDFA